MLSTTQTQDPYLNAINALGQAKFKLFFSCIEQIKNNQGNVAGLIDHAISVFVNLNQIDNLVELSKFAAELKEHNKSTLLAKLIRALVCLEKPQAYYAAITVTTLYAMQTNGFESLWFTLCESFVARKEYTYVENIYPYLKSENDKNNEGGLYFISQAGHERYKIAKKILDQLNLADNPLLWFTWFCRYLPLVKSYISYGGEYINQALQLMTESQDIEKLILILSKVETQVQEKFLKEVFFKYLKNRQFEKIETLLSHLPTLLNGLKKIYKTLTDIRLYPEIENEINREGQEVKNDVWELMCENFVENYKTESSEEIIKTMLDILSSVRFDKNNILTFFCLSCCAKGRNDVTLSFIKTYQLENTQFNEICQRLLETPQAPDDYIFMLKKIRIWPDDITVLDKIGEFDTKQISYNIVASYSLLMTLKTLYKIPRQLVLEENKQREEMKRSELKEEENNFLQAAKGTITEKKQRFEFRRLITLIQYHIKNKNLDQALALTERITGSKFRDELIVPIAIGFWRLGENVKTQQACALLKHKESTCWKEWPQRFNSKKYKKTLDWLCSNNLDENRILIDLYLEIIFANSNAQIALEHILSSELIKKLDFEKYNKNNISLHHFQKVTEIYIGYESRSFDEDAAETITVTSGAEEYTTEWSSIEERIVGYFIAVYADSNKLLGKMQELHAKGVKGIETAIIGYHLRRYQLDKAIEIINLFPLDEQSLNKNFFEKDIKREIISGYFKNKSPQDTAILKRVRKIKSSLTRAIIYASIIEGWDLRTSNTEDFIRLKIIIKEANELESRNHQDHVLVKCFDFSDESPTQAHAMLIKEIRNTELKKKFFRHFILFAFPDYTFFIYQEALVCLGKSDFWFVLLDKTIHAQNNKLSYLDVLKYILEQPDDWQEYIISSNLISTKFNNLLTSLVKKSIVNDNTLETYELIYQQLLLSIQKDDWRNKFFYENLFQDTINIQVDRAKSDKKLMSPLLSKLEGALSNTNINKKFICKMATNLAEFLVEQNDDEHIRQIILILYTHNNPDGYSNIYQIRNLLHILIKRHKLGLSCDLLVSFIQENFQQLIGHSSDSPFMALCNAWIERNQIQTVLKFINQVETLLHTSLNINKEGNINLFKYHTISLLVNIALNLVANKKYSDILEFYRQHLQNADARFIEPLLDALIKENQLAIAAIILTGTIQRPDFTLCYQRKIIQQHFIRLSKLTSQDFSNKIQSAYIQLISFFCQSEQKSAAEINKTKNLLIKFAREILDKAFLHFFRTHFNYPFVKKQKPIHFYFPIVPNEKAPWKEQLLLDYFKNLNCAQFPTSFPDLYRYLLAIQPLHNVNYTWLEQLREMSNLDKHDTDLPERPMIRGVEINMKQFLPTMVQGVELIVIKLFNHALNVHELDEMALSKIFVINQDSAASAAAYFQTPDITAPSPPLPFFPH